MASFLRQPTASSIAFALRTLTRTAIEAPKSQSYRLITFCASRPFVPFSQNSSPRTIPSRFFGAQRRRINTTPIRRIKNALQPSKPQQPSSSSSKKTAQQQSSSPTQPPQNLRSRLAQLWKQYGLVSVTVYTAISTIDLALSFWLIRVKGAGFVKPVEDFVKKYLPDLSGIFGKPPHMPDAEEERAVAEGKIEQEGSRTSSLSWWSTFAIAYGFHKLLVPLRVPLAAMATPSVARWIKGMGWKVVGWKVSRLPIKRK